MTIVTVRPNGQRASSHAATITGGSGTSYGVISDSSDSSYLSGQVAGMYINFDYGSYTLNVGERCYSAQLRVRAQRNSSGGTSQDTTHFLYDITHSNNKFVCNVTVARSGTAITTDTGPASRVAPASGGEWTQSAIDNVGSQIMWQQVHSGVQNVFQRVMEVYLDLDIRHQPATSTPVVTNFTGNTTPTVTWSYSDSDFDTQRAYRVKIFDAATIASGGFSADSSTAAFDTGDAYGTDNSVRSTALVNGTTYTAYVKVGKLGIAPGESVWWSNWTTSSTFTITFISPYAPIIQSGTVITDQSQYRAVTKILVPVNLLTADNSGFETTLGQWASLSNCGVTRNTSQHADGAASMTMTASGSGDMTALCGIDLLGNPRVDYGTTMTIVASFKANSSTRSCSVGLRFLQVDKVTAISTTYGSTATDSASGWTQVSCTVAVPAGAVFAQPVVKVASAGAGEIHWVDKVDIHAGTAVTYVPGGYINRIWGLYVWRCEILDPSRGPAENWMHPQCHGGMVFRNASHGFAWDASQSLLIWQWLDTVIPGDNTPAGMFRWQTFAGSGPYVEIGHNYFGGSTWATPTVPAMQFVFSCWAWVDTGTASVKAQIRFRPWDGGTNLSTVDGATVTLTTTPQRLIAVGTAPTGAGLMSGVLVNTTNDHDKHIYFTKCGIGPGTAPVDAKQARGGDQNWTLLRFLGANDTQENMSYPVGFATGNVEIVPDYEYPPGRAVWYQAAISYDAGNSVTLGSPDSNVQVVYGDPPAVTMLRGTVDPTMAVAVNRRKAASLSISDDAQVFHPLGTDAAPIRVRDWVGGVDGSLICITSTESQAERLAKIIASNDVLQIQWAQGGRTFILITGVGIEETISSDIDFCDADGVRQGWMNYRVTTLTYVETGAP